MMKGIAAALAAFALALPAAATAQQTAEQVADRYLQTLKMQDWAANAALMDPAELDSMKAAVVYAASVDTSTAGLRELFGVTSVADMRALAPPTVYQRFAANVIGAREGTAQFLGSATFRVMGHVQEGDTAWVVYRVSAAVPGNAAASQVSLVALRNVGGAWKVRLNEEVKGMMAGLRAAADERSAAAAAVERLRASGQLPREEPAQPRARPAPAPVAPPPARP